METGRRGSGVAHGSNAVIDPRLAQWLGQAVEVGASDLHLASGFPPTVRVHGELRPLDDRPLEAGELLEMLQSVCPAPVRPGETDRHDADFSLEIEHGTARRRFRVNIFRHEGAWGACFRHVPPEIPTLEWAGFDREVAERILRFRNGLVLFTGITGSGKSTSMAMLVDLLCRRRPCRVVTVEEPIEYRLPAHERCVITQREVGVDVPTFYDGLKYGLRQDPDVILVGEIRDRETAQMALSAAETGHLVFATLHTRDAAGAVSRLIDLFPHDAQQSVRSQLSLSLRAVIAQHLLPPATPGEKRVLAIEVLFNNFAVASAIRFGKIESLATAIQTGRRDGMIPLDESLSRLLRAGRITRETARAYATDPEEMG